MNSSFPVFLNCSRESREVPEFIVPTLIEKNTNFLADRGSAKDGLKLRLPAQKSILSLIPALLRRTCRRFCHFW